MIVWVPADPQYHDAVRELLTKTADLIAEDDGVTCTEDFLRDGAVWEADLCKLPGSKAASWVAREARYRIACTVAIAPRDRDDPMIGVVIEVLARHPAQVQANILRAAAECLRGRSPAARR